MMRQSILVVLFFFSFSIYNYAFAQKGNIEISGKIINSADGQAVPYATVVCKSSITEKILIGATTDENGQFIIRTDSSSIFIEVRFMGFEPRIIRELNKKNSQIKLGKIELIPGAQSLSEVIIAGEKSTVEFKLDKRVFNVGKDISSSGMGALDVLNNVPSVNVDIEGQVSLRGNTGVQMLINGKPSVLADEESNALGTITADMIESIEVITNPSAKYEAEGTSGIINIILKKQEKKGVNGSISINTGIPDNHSIGGSLNYRTEKFNFFSQFGAGYRSNPRFSNSRNINLNNNSEILSEGTDFRNENFYNVTIGTDYYLNDQNTITLSGNYAYEIETQPSLMNIILKDEEGVSVSEYDREGVTDATNPKWQYDLQYKRQFKNHEDHVLLFSTLGSFFGKDQSSEFTNNYILGTVSENNQRTTTNYYQADYTFKLDYTNPISERVTLETGALYEINDVGNDFAVFNYLDNQWVPDIGLTNNFEYDQKVLGVYLTGAYESKKWGVKLGLRAENTDLRTLLTNTNESNIQQFTNLFPTLHSSYKVSSKVSLQAGYSRRIFRPRLWDLNPFFNIQNNFNIRQGSPDLLPQFADSYELTGIAIFDKLSLNASVYHLFTTNVIERVSYFENGINITSPRNIGTNNKTGFELNGKYNALDWLTLTGDFNYGMFVRKGQFEDQNFDFTGNQWTAETTMKIKFPGDIDLEITPNYQSAYKTVQGEVSGFAFLDVGLRKKIAKGKAVVNIAVRDVFASRIRESIVRQPNFYFYDFSQRGRFITFGFSYSFGKGEAMSYTGRRR